MVPSLTILVLASGLWSTALAAPAVSSDVGAGQFNSSDNPFHFTLSAVNAFPNATGNLSAFDIDAIYLGYSPSDQAWLASLDPSSAATDQEKAQILTEAAYGQPYDETNPDMTGDVAALLAAVNGDQSLAIADDMALSRRAENKFATSAKHAVIWHSCAAFFSCVAGVTCTYSVTPNTSPRDQCKKVGSQNCCVSWSTTKVKVGFFARTWDECNDIVNDEKLTKASCEGYGASAGGDVCLSNRPKGCT